MRDQFDSNVECFKLKRSICHLRPNRPFFSPDCTFFFDRTDVRLRSKNDDFRRQQKREKKNRQPDGMTWILSSYFRRLLQKRSHKPNMTKNSCIMNRTEHARYLYLKRVVEYFSMITLFFSLSLCLLFSIDHDA